MKTLYEYDAINVTLGLPFFRISPDHGPNIEMIGKNKSNHKIVLKTFQIQKVIHFCTVILISFVDRFCQSQNTRRTILESVL